MEGTISNSSKPRRLQSSLSTAIARCCSDMSSICAGADSSIEMFTERLAVNIPLFMTGVSPFSNTVVSDVTSESLQNERGKKYWHFKFRIAAARAKWCKHRDSCYHAYYAVLQSNFVISGMVTRTTKAHTSRGHSPVFSEVTPLSWIYPPSILGNSPLNRTFSLYTYSSLDSLRNLQT